MTVFGNTLTRLRVKNDNFITRLRNGFAAKLFAFSLTGVAILRLLSDTEDLQSDPFQSGLVCNAAVLHFESEEPPQQTKRPSMGWNLLEWSSVKFNVLGIELIFFCM